MFTLTTTATYTDGSERQMPEPEPLSQAHVNKLVSWYSDVLNDPKINITCERIRIEVRPAEELELS